MDKSHDIDLVTPSANHQYDLFTLERDQLVARGCKVYILTAFILASSIASAGLAACSAKVDLGLDAVVTEDKGKPKVDNAVDQGASIDRPAGTRNHVPQGGNDEKSDLAPTEPLG